MADFVVGRGAPGGAVNLGSAFPTPSAPAVDLEGTAPAGRGVSFPLVPVDAPPSAAPSGPATMGGGMGAAAASMFPTIAELPAGNEGGVPLPPRPRPEEPAPPTRPMTALERAAAENQSYAQTLAEYLAANPVQTVTSLSPFRPLVEEKAQFQSGGGDLPVAPFKFVPPEIPRNEGESDEDYAARVQVFAETAYREQLDEYQRKAAEQQAAAQLLGDVRDIGTPGHLGMREAQLQAAENLGQAQIEQQLAVTTAQTQAAESQRAAIEAARAAEQERRAFAQQQRDAMIQLQETEKAARAKIDALPELDGQRFFKSLKGGQKFWGILGAVLGGSVGIDVASQFRQAALDDLEEQKANAAQVFAQGDKASADVQQASTIYQDLIRSSGDESVADSMWIKLQMEDAATELERVLSQTTEPVLRAQLQQDLVNLRQQIFDEEQRIEVARIQTPWRISTTYDPIGRKNRERVVKQIDKAQEQGFELTKLGIEGEEKGLERAARLQEKQVEGQAKVAAQRQGEQIKAEMDIKKASDEWGAVETLVGDFLADNPDDIAGVGAPLTGSQADRIRTRQFQSALELLMTSGFTGATATDRQAQQIKDMVEGGVFEMDDEAFRVRMTEIMNIASARRRFYQNQLGSPDARIGDPAKGLPSFQPEE